MRLGCKIMEREHNSTATATTPSVAGNVDAYECAFPSCCVARVCALPVTHDPAFTFMDYEQDWDGVAITLTWSQLYRRTLNVVQERAVVVPRVTVCDLAPQGLEYVAAFRRVVPGASPCRFQFHKAALPMNVRIRY